MSGERFLVVDVETTGLEFPGIDLPLEYGVGIYDLNLEKIDDFAIQIWDSPEYDKRYDSLSGYVHMMHSANGLLHECMDDGADLTYARSELTDFLKGHGVNPEKDPMVGSSIQFDRNVLFLFAKSAHDLFHYRNIDTSSIKELCRRINPEVYAKLPEGRKIHRVLPDIEDTVAELKFYIDNFCFDGRV